MATRSQIVASASIFLLTMITSTAQGNSRCPSGSSRAGDYCFTNVDLKHEWEKSKARASHKFASSECSELSLGDLSWWLPKADSVAKNADIGRYFLQRSESLRGTYVWLGLRRYENASVKDPLEWADPHKWYWTIDNTTVWLMRKQNIDLWEKNQPIIGEQCAVGFFIEGKFQWRSSHCEYQNGTDALDIGLVVCEARLPRELAIYEQPWFYGLCASLMVLSIIILAIAGFIYCRYKKPHRRRRKKQKSQRSIIGQRPQVQQTCPIVRKKRTWYQPPEVKSTDGTPSSKKSSPVIKKSPIADDDDSVAYSNLQPLKDVPKAATKLITASAKPGSKPKADGYPFEKSATALKKGYRSPSGSAAASLTTLPRSPKAVLKKTERK